MSSPHAIKVTSQKKSLEIKFADAFKAVIKGVKDVIIFNPEELGLDLIDLGKALNLATSVEQKAYLLITEGYTGALASIWRIHWTQFKQSNNPKDLEFFADKFDAAIQNAQPGLMPEFFLAPHELPVVKTFVEILTEHLPRFLVVAELKKEPELAREIAETFPDRFYQNIIAAWNVNQDRYLDIWGYFHGNKFLDVDKHLKEFRILAAQEAYHNSLRKMYHEVVMDDEAGMTLADIYIKPNFRISERCFGEKDERYRAYKRIERHSPFIPVEYPASIHEFMFEFLEQKNPLSLTSSKAKVLLLLGYPGQGKTSFCKRFIHDLLVSGRSKQHVFYLPLRIVKNVREKLSSPLDLVLEALNNDLPDTYPGTVTEKLLRKSVLILDGLDEIFQREGLSHADIFDFCRELGRLTVDTPDLRIILTSRYGYITHSKLRKKEFLIAQLDTLPPPEQSEWLEKYKKFHPKTRLSQEKLTEINDEKNKSFTHLRELINQPILLQLVATANYELQATDTRTKIYNELFQSLIDRNWDKGGPLDNLEGLEKEDVLSYLSDIAMAIYQSEFEYIRKVDLEKLPTTEDFLDKLKGKGLKDVLKNLMIAFYMKEVKKEGSDPEEENRNYAIEFLHKSLQEYLVARNIWETAKNEFLEYRGRSKQKKYAINSWKDALKVIRGLFAQKELSSEVQEYLVEMIQQDSEEEKNELQERLLGFLNEMTLRDFGEFSKIRSDDSSPFKESLNSFYGYWLLISHIGLDEKKWKEIHPYRITKFLRSPRHFHAKYVWLLEKANLGGAILTGANLESAFLTGADLRAAILDRAYLKGANLTRAILDRAYLDRAYLKGANLESAFIRGAHLNSAHLEDANFQLVNLERAYLKGANLQGANLKKAFLTGAFLEGADLQGANLEKANLQGANLQGANLVDAQLRIANLTRANLAGANLAGAILTGAILTGAILLEANLTGVNLIGVNLHGARVDKINWLDKLNLATESKKEVLFRYKVISNIHKSRGPTFIISKRE